MRDGRPTPEPEDPSASGRGPATGEPEVDVGAGVAPADPERGPPAPTGLADDYDAEVLALLDAWEPPEHLRDRPLPSRLTAWSRSSLIGALAAGTAFGLRDVLDPPQDEPIVIEVDADGEPHDLPIRLLLDPDDPSGSLCIVRRDPRPPLV